jgi:hypothetical protein
MNPQDERQPPPESTEGADNVLRITFLSLVAALGGFLFGFDSGIINGTVEALQGEFNSDAVGTGFNVASMLLGSAAGAFFAGNLADRFGRRPAMILTAIAFMISAWGSGVSGSSAEFVFFRVLGGLAVGAASILAPAYISEIAPARIRGSLATLQQLMIVIGRRRQRRQCILVWIRRLAVDVLDGIASGLSFLGHPPSHPRVAALLGSRRTPR